jgi:hypothetical protein
MNYFDKRLIIIDKVNIKILHNLRVDIYEFMINSDILSNDRISISQAIKRNSASALICCNKDLPKYVIYIKVGNLVVKEINNIDTNSLLLYIKRYDIPLTEKIKLII